MKPNRYWYNNGRIEKIEDSSYTISFILMNADLGMHFRWRTSGTRIPFFNEQYDLLAKKIRIKKKAPGSLPEKAFFQKEIKSLLHRNRVFKGSLLHIFLLPPLEGLSGDKPGLYFFTENYPDENFIMNSKGWILAKTGSISRENGRIVELADDSIFVIKGDKIYTPSLDMGVQPRAIREAIIRIAPGAGLAVVETDKLESRHLLVADEIFAANDIDGIRWIGGYKTKRYYRKYSESINRLINKEWEEAD